MSGQSSQEARQLIGRSDPPRGHTTIFIVYRTDPVYAVVELDEGPRLVSNIEGVNAEEWADDVSPKCGTRVRYEVEKIGDAMSIPLFRPI